MIEVTSLKKGGQFFFLTEDVMKDKGNTETVIYVDSWPATTQTRPMEDNLIYSVFVIEIASTPIQILLKKEAQGLCLPGLKLRKTDFLNPLIQDSEQQRIRNFFGSQWGLLPSALEVIGLIDFPRQNKIIKLISFKVQMQLKHFWQEFPTQFMAIALAPGLPKDLVLTRETACLLNKYLRYCQDQDKRHQHLQLVETIDL